MEIQINSINSATKELIISIPLKEFDDQINLAYRDTQKNIEMKGFRRGRVPIPLIKKIYGKQIEEEVVSNLASSLFKQALEKEKIEVVGKPFFLEHKIGSDKVDFVFNYDIIPDFQLSDYKGIKIFEPIHRVTEDEIQREISSLLFSVNKTKSIDKVIHNNVLVKCQTKALDKETEQITEDTPRPLSIYLSEASLPQRWKELFWGKEVGDEFVAYPREFDNSVPDFKFLFHITEILEPDFDQLDEEYIKHLTYGRLSTLEDYKEDVGFQLQQHWDNKSKKELEHQIIDYLVEHNDFELPKSVLEETALKIAEDFAKEYLKDRKLSDEEYAQLVENVYPLAQRQVKWAIIKKKIAEMEHIEVEDYDIEDFAQYLQNSNNLEFEEAKKIILQDKRLQDIILDKKVIDFLISFAETEEIEFDDYYKKREHHHHHHEDEVEYNEEATNNEDFQTSSEISSEVGEQTMDAEKIDEIEQNRQEQK